MLYFSICNKTKALRLCLTIIILTLFDYYYFDFHIFLINISKKIANPIKHLFS